MERGVSPGDIVIQAADGATGSSWLRFRAPWRIVSCSRVSEVRAALAEVAGAVEAGAWAAGFLSYEAAPAFDPAFTTHPPGSLPLLWFGIYDDPERIPSIPAPEDALPVPDWQPTVGRDAYDAAIARIKDYIAAGDTYQVNYTMRLRAPFTGDAWALFRQLVSAQRTQYAAYVDTGEHALCSASPELFFTLSGEEIAGRPMKGTAPRGLTTAGDGKLAAWLAASEKNRAENVMIVDMVRNDLGRVARPGSVTVPRLFEVERYDTLFQMTSTVTARTEAPVEEILAAIFPCASITGAPKIRTMEIIAELETSPRGIYTGAIGFLAPGRRAQFNVAIRTVHVDRDAGLAEYGTGGGIVWDSTPGEEYEECRTKARVLFSRREPFRLLETLRWRPEEGYFLLDRHLARLADSADYFGFAADPGAAQRALWAAAEGFAPRPMRVRLLVSEEGEIETQAFPLDLPSPHPPFRVALARRPVDRTDRFLYHKTTRRALYEAARADFPDHDDVLLWNDRGEVTESTLANVVVTLRGERVTPPVECGLLAGTYRAELLDAGEIREGIVTLADLRGAEAVHLVNSVRGRVPAVLTLA